jgi:L-lysine 2,3-aminomutase
MNLLNQGQVENLIMQIADALDDTTHIYAEISDRAATAEADYKLRVARAVITLANTDTKMTAIERQARADIASAEELRTWKTLEASRQATKEHLLSLRARLDALRTLNASIRSATGG